MMLTKRVRAARAPVTDPAPDIARVEESLLADLTRTLARAAAGDLEARVDVGEATGPLAESGRRLNHLLDLVDAFMREASAGLEAAAQGQYYRLVLRQGLSGSFREAAGRIDDSRALIKKAAEHIAAEEELRDGMALRARDISTSVSGAATELSASAEALTASMGMTVEEVHAATSLVEGLREAADRIQSSANLIERIAAQTRLLALNAHIEAARAGESGRGFGVVAEEVKQLADETASTLSEITTQVETTVTATAQVAEAMERISAVVRDVDGQAKGISEAAGGHGGLSYLAERLTTDVGVKASDA